MNFQRTLITTSLVNTLKTFLDTDWENLQTLATDGRYYILDNVDLNELRDSLRLGMDVAGFSSYYKEYWHFSYRDHLKMYGDICYDRPIQ